ncbi:MAG: lipopolysaccharide core heptose(II) kinase RfaY [Fulvivirga sp.]|nr:lipopolysaccharide core heptose(II) kinase RfaY [Fulvivirga sp.]
MRKIAYNNWNLLIPDKMSDSKGRELFDSVSKQEYEILDILKQHYRSTVLKIRLSDQEIVHKVPTEKNKKRWIRFLTWFRQGEAFKNLRNMELLWSKGIKTTVPLLAAEKKRLGMVVDSWLLYEYLDGTTCLNHPEYYPEVVKQLKDIHAKGLLHGDPQIRNFIAKANDIYVIDCNPEATGITGFGKAYEFAYLKRSAPGIQKHFGKVRKWWLYRLAIWYDKTERRLKRKKRKIFNQKR